MLYSDFQKRREEHRALKQACSSLAGKKAKDELMKIEEEIRGMEEEMMKEASEKLKTENIDTTTKKTKKSKKEGFSRRNDEN